MFALKKKNTTQWHFSVKIPKRQALVTLKELKAPNMQWVVKSSRNVLFSPPIMFGPAVPVCIVATYIGPLMWCSQCGRLEQTNSVIITKHICDTAKCNRCGKKFTQGTVGSRINRKDLVQREPPKQLKLWWEIQFRSKNWTKNFSWKKCWMVFLIYRIYYLN